MKEQKQASLENSIKDLSALLVQQTAELALKNRELEIEAALECVRARSMAMHKSEELRDVIKVIYEQLVQLNFNISAAGFLMDYRETDDWNLWVADALVEYPTKLHIPYFDHPFYNDYLEHKNKGPELFTRIYSFEEKNSWLEDILKYLPGVPEEVKEFLFNSPGLATSRLLLKNIGLFLVNYNGTPYSDLENSTLIRFGKVFEQTYTRFLDLQKAEAQAREAQIETALERVRSRSMAMHKSEELRDVIKVVYDQLIQLNFEINTSGFMMDYRETDDMNLWVADALVEFPTKLHIPYFDHPFYNEYLEHKNKGPELFTKLYSFEEKNSWMEDVLKYLPGVPEEVKEFVFSSPALAISRLLLKNIGLYLFNYNGTPYSDSENSTFIRFGKVFEQTYTRFLDLQKAEAQALEAQIETALERVRSRSMAMHKSDELRDVIKVIYEQLVQLNFEITDSGFLMDYRESDDHNLWMANALAEFPTIQHIPYFDHPLFNDYVGQKNKGPELFTKLYSFEEKNSFLEEVFKYLPGPEEVKEFVFSLPALALSRLLLKNIGLYLINYNGTPYSDSENSTFIRFGKVFEQTYTRFLDLQKAEAQAREAQIETALERVRSRSLAMHKSDELQEVITVVLEQLQKLGINPESSFINIFYEDTRDLNMWIASPGMVYAQKFHIPYFKHPILDDVWVAKDRGEIFLTSDYSLEEKNSFFKTAFMNSDLKFVPDDRKKYLLESKGYTRSFAFSKNSGLAIQNYEGIPYTNRENEIIKRFARVFEQAYTRFLDVQKAEEQAREAQIETALERVRASSLAMHHSDDLHIVITVVSDQFLWLGLHFEATHFGITNPDRSWDLWLSGAPRGVRQI